MTDYSRHFQTKQTPQSEPIPGTDQVPNSAGGFTWQLDDWGRLNRFLVIGAEGNTLYATEREMTIENAQVVTRCLREDGPRTVEIITEISHAGRAPKNDQCLFALAMAASPKFADAPTRKAALAVLPKVARIGTHLFLWLKYADALGRGWGRGMRNAVAAWYNDKDANRLAYQVIKYRQRHGWTHRDVLRQAHPAAPDKPHQHLYHWLTQGKAKKQTPSLVGAFEYMQAAEHAEIVMALLNTYPDLPWETIPTQFLKSAKVWGALLPRLPMTALMRNLGRMSANGLIVPLTEAADIAAERIVNAEAIHRARVHPIQVLAALLTYQAGHGARGKLTWEPVSQVVDALDAAFYLAFDNVEPSGKRIILALDVSGSMTAGTVAGVPGLTPRVASAAMAMVTARTEKRHHVVAFSGEMVPFEVSPRERLDDVCRKADRLDFGRTDCALPMLWALGYQPMSQDWYGRSVEYQKTHDYVAEVDAFVIYTDSETWCGDIHPSQALAQYRRETGIAAKLIVCGMVANSFTIADPADAGMLDVVGFSTATPNLISNFIRGDLG